MSWSQVFREIKDAFDPLDQFNPGKVIGDDPHLMLEEPEAMARAAARAAAGSATTPTPFLGKRRDSPASTPSGDRPRARRHSRSAQWRSRRGCRSSSFSPPCAGRACSLIEMASTCQGCGTCRSLDPTSRMCPSFRALRREAASPRSQANLIREVATGQVDPRLWGADEFKAHADLCIHCKLCRTECPSAVDVSSLMLEAKAAYVEKHGLPPSDWIFSRIEFWARLGSRFPIITNFLLSRRTLAGSCSTGCWACRGTGCCRGCGAPRSRAGPRGWG